MQEYGCMVEVTELVNGQISEAPGQLGEAGGDIKTKGLKIFRILEVIKELPDKLFSGAIVNYPVTVDKGKPVLMQKVMSSVRALHELLKVSKEFNKPDAELSSYELAHHVGLSIEEEYELLQLLEEKQRQEYLKRHLIKVIAMMTGMEQLKEKIKLNGHFKNLGGFDLGK